MECKNSGLNDQYQSIYDSFMAWDQCKSLSQNLPNSWRKFFSQNEKRAWFHSIPIYEHFLLVNQRMMHFANQARNTSWTMVFWQTQKILSLIFQSMELHIPARSLHWWAPGKKLRIFKTLFTVVPARHHFWTFWHNAICQHCVPPAIFASTARKWTGMCWGRFLLMFSKMTYSLAQWLWWNISDSWFVFVAKILTFKTRILWI